MDLCKLFTGVKSLSDYTNITKELAHKNKANDVQLNMASVMALDSVRSLELEYFNKFHDKGAAFILLKWMLNTPPCETWATLGKKLLLVIHYWLLAVRKNLILRHPQWWMFLKTLLYFMKEIQSKDKRLVDLIVEHTTSVLLDLSTNDRMTSMQRQELLHAFNMWSTVSNRNLRKVFSPCLQPLFVKLSVILATCDYLPTQFCIMECLLRWLVDRNDPAVRANVADKWFPGHLYCRDTVELFKEKHWIHFHEDTRDFLNAHNQTSERVTSVICRAVTINDVNIPLEEARIAPWLDINPGSRCMTILLDHYVLNLLGAPMGCSTSESLVILSQDASDVQLRWDHGLTVKITTSKPPQILPSSYNLFHEGSGMVQIVITSTCNVGRVDRALKEVFDEKYKLLLSVDQLEHLSPVANRRKPNRKPVVTPQVSTELSCSGSGAAIRRRKIAEASFSGTSATSLAQFRDKSDDLPTQKYPRHLNLDLAGPNLSNIGELSQSGVTRNLIRNNPEKQRAHSDGDSLKETFLRDEYGAVPSSNKCHSEGEHNIYKPDNKHSSLLIKTVGVDNSLPNEGLETLPEHERNADGIISLLQQEAKCNEIDTAKEGVRERETPGFEFSGVIEDTESRTSFVAKKTKSNDDIQVKNIAEESNTIEDTLHCYVNVKRRQAPKPSISYSPEDIFEDFFAHTVRENTNIKVATATLSRKGNQTTLSESTDSTRDTNIAQNDGIVTAVHTNEDATDPGIVGCLNSNLDKVCREFEECANYIDKNDECEIQNVVQEKSLSKTNRKSKNIKGKKGNDKKETKMTLKLKFPKKRVVKKQSKPETTPVLNPAMSPIFERTEINDNLSDENKLDEPLANRKKRKLYSPKEQLKNEHPNEETDSGATKSSTVQHTRVSESPKAISYYKDVEKTRQEYRIRLRNKRTKGELQPQANKQNELFDQVIGSVDNPERVTLVDKKTSAKDLSAYNYTSDSSDEELIKKKSELKQRISSYHVNINRSSSVSNRSRARKLVQNPKKIPKNSSDQIYNTQNKKRRNIHNIEKTDLIDQQIRSIGTSGQSGPVEINTSFILENPSEKLEISLEPKIKTPALDIVPEISSEQGVVSGKIKVSKKESNKKKQVKKLTVSEDINEDKKNEELDKSSSPLPGLVIESEKQNYNDSLSKNFAEEFKKQLQGIPDSSIDDNIITDFDMNIGNPPMVNDDHSKGFGVEIQDSENLGSVENLNAERYTASPEPHFITVTTRAIVHEPPKSHGKTNKFRKLTLKKDKIVNQPLMADCIPPANDYQFVIETGVKNAKKAIDISDDTVAEFEPSIASDDIRAHNDPDQVPPDSESLDRSVEFREVHDMNQSSKELYVRLRKAAISYEPNKGAIDYSISPRVSVEKLSIENIQKYISPKKSLVSKSKSSSESLCGASSKASSKSNSPSKTDDGHRAARYITRQLQHNKKTNRKSKSAVSKKSKTLSSKTSDNISQSRTKHSPNVSTSKRISIKTSSPKESPVVVMSSPAMDTNTAAESKTPRITRHSQVRTIISPVKLYDELLENRHDTIVPGVEDSNTEIRVRTRAATLAASKSSTDNVRTNFFEEWNVCDEKNTHVEKSNVKKFLKRTENDVNKDISTCLDSSSSNSVKRKSPSINAHVKRRKLYDASSQESVAGWLCTNTGARDAANIEDFFDGLQERIETTLSEIHAESTTKAVNIYMSAEEGLKNELLKREQFYERLINEISKMMTKDKQNGMAVINKFKREFEEVIKETSKKQQCMVVLIKEDIEAMKERLTKKTVL